ncbi:MAG: ankyrin repeat domain-containing protein [Bacteroidota bacterium]
MQSPALLKEFVLAATVEPQSWHKSGSLDAAQDLLDEYPGLAERDFLCALVLGQFDVVVAALQQNPDLVRRKLGPREWEPLLYVCFSEFFRLDLDRRADFCHCAERLIEAGADPNAYFLVKREKETALYGAIGLANSAEMGRLLLKAGATLDDGELYYHSAEFDGVEGLAMLIEEFGIPEEHAATALLRKLDFPDLVGLERLLSLGLDPNNQGHWQKNALHQALLRNRSLPFISLLLAHGADPNQPHGINGQTAYQMAARMGRVEVLETMEKAGANTQLSQIDRFLAACTRADREEAVACLRQTPNLIEQLDPREDLRLLVDCAQRNQIEVVDLMLDVGFPIDAKDEQGQTATHVACWNGYVELLDLLLSYHAPLEALNNYGGTVIDATVWGYAHHPDPDKPMEFILQRLIDAGANLKAISPYPSGNARVDAFLSQYL